MTIEFNLIIPDEPYKNTFSLKKGVKCRYIGPRYLVLRYELESGSVVGIDGRTDSPTEYDLTTFSSDNHGFVLFDAESNPFIAASVTGYYENDPVGSFVESLPTGEVYTFEYESPRGILGQMYDSKTVKYNPNTKIYTNPEILKPALTREAWLEGKLSQAQEIERSLASKEIESTARETLTSFVSWVKNIDKNYPGVDHWKLPTPTGLPDY